MDINHLPIDAVIPKFLAAVRNNSNVILHAQPGAGKTTRIPIALLEQMPVTDGKIIMLEPRRLAASAAARHMSALLGKNVGETVGYRMRFENRVSSTTHIEVVTEGILTRMIQNDPFLEGVAMVIFDEFHERSIHADLGLALCLEIQRQVRHDLKIVVMSATLDHLSLSKVLGDAPLVSSSGSSFPVEVFYSEASGSGKLADRVNVAVHTALEETEGDILVFLPGAGEIRSCFLRLSESGVYNKAIELHQLYGDLPFEKQQEALLPSKNRKVILATSIAETSLTIQGVRVVIDCGLSRRLQHDPKNGMNRLVTVRECKASSIQRSGRAGRTAPGVCYRLFGQHTFNGMIPFSPAEILEADLSPLILELSAFGVSEPAQLSWIDVPPNAAVTAARTLLQQLGAIDEELRITVFGRKMASIPLHPRLSAMLLKGLEFACVEAACDLAAILSERDVVRRGDARFAVDHIGISLSERMELLKQWRYTKRTASSVDVNAMKSVDKVAGQLRGIVGKSPLPTGGGGVGCVVGNHDISRSHVQPSHNPLPSRDGELAPMDISVLLLAAMPDRVACRREIGSERYLLANGRGARLVCSDDVGSSPFIIAATVTGGEYSEAVIHIAEKIDEATLKAECGNRIISCETCYWDQRERRVIAVREERFGSLLLSSQQIKPHPGQVADVILDAVLQSKLSLLTLNDSFFQLQGRIMLIHKYIPEADMPDVSDSGLCNSLENWFLPALETGRTISRLDAIDCHELLQNSLNYHQNKKLQELAPTHLLVPSGSRIRLDYCQGDSPVLAVKLQELFGLAETPAVAAGRVPVVLHLLSPAGRPLQVTQDLRGFWDGSYHEIKKEMKGRYPKHPWPDDPWNALPTRRVKAKN